MVTMGSTGTASASGEAARVDNFWSTVHPDQVVLHLASRGGSSWRNWTWYSVDDDGYHEENPRGLAQGPVSMRESSLGG